VLSKLPEIIFVPSLLNYTDFTSPPCPVRVAITAPPFVGHTLIVSSLLPEATFEPSGENAMHLTD